MRCHFSFCFWYVILYSDCEAQTMAKKGQKGKQGNQGKQYFYKLKPYLIMRYLQRESDNQHLKTADDIVAYLEDKFNILSERKSIYRDIKEINTIYLLEYYNNELKEEWTIQEAQEYLKTCGDDEKAIIYKQINKNNRGFYWTDRGFSEDDIFLLAECINSAKFISKKEAKKFIEDISDTYLSKYQRELINKDVFLVDRARINRNDMIYTILTINNAMRISAYNPKPRKISFYYLKYTISNLHEQVNRRKGERYIVSPYKLIVNDGNYYLLAFNDKIKKMRTYRIDRMKDIKELDEEREGEEAYKDISNIKDYIKEKFNMFDGKREQIEIQFTSDLLDTFVERFGAKNNYFVKDERHYSIKTFVEVSTPFFGWLCGFGNKVKILSPESAQADFRKHLEKILTKYE